jgi:hypothetical protein
VPGDVVLSTFVTLASGLGFTITDTSRGSGPNLTQVLLFAGRPDAAFAYQSVDLRVEKLFRFPPHQQASVALEGFNVFNHTNFGCYEGFIPTLPAVNADFGKPRCTVDNSSRRMQVGVRYSF